VNSPETAPAPPASSRRALLFGTVASGTGVLFGYGIGVIAPALLPLTEELQLTVSQQALLVSTALVASVVAAPVSGTVADRLGRRTSLVLIGAVYCAGCLLGAAADTLGPLVAGRFLVGLSIGAASFIGPMYVAEIAPRRQRGMLVTLNQLMITIGILAAAVVGYLLAASGDWRLLVGLGAAPGAALTVAIALLPESPRWLAARGRHTAADRARRRLGAAGGLPEDEAETAETAESGENEAPAPWKALLRPPDRRLAVVGVVIAVAVHFSGLNMAVYYAPTILARSGLGSVAATYGGMWVAAANVLTTVLTLLVIDRAGRRPLFISGISLMAVAALMLGLLPTGDGRQSAWVTVFLVVFIVAGAAGPAGVFWTYVAELYPQRIRSTAMGITAAGHWAADVVVGATFLPLVAATSMSFTFWTYAALSAAAALFCLRHMPETRGRALGDARVPSKKSAKNAAQRPVPQTRSD
jgi:SP family galactose:H+ symporter-like MFS transporter